MIRRFWSWLRAAFPALVVLAAFCWAGATIAMRRHNRVAPDTKVVLRLGHWQLEAGVRQAFDAMAAEYRKLHPDVQIVQDAIPEGTYGQWMTTQLMGGTAPDIIEVGMLPYNVILGYHARYFVPLTAHVNQPNPYNAGTALADVSWRRTYKDGMRNSYIDELQEYMLVPLAQFGIRVFYNRDLLRKLTGRDEAPREYREFLAVCAQIAGEVDARGRPYIPIAASAYHAGMWESLMCDPLTYGAVRLVDFNRDGVVANDELYVGTQTGRIGFDFPPYVAKFRMMRELTEQFQSGFTGLGRDEAVFLFAQQRAVFISTGTWDAGSLLEQARGVFEVGIMDFPRPGRDDPAYGPIVEGPPYERPSAGFPFAITRSSKHPEVALDFLQFLGSQRGNAELNRIIGWIPAIEGAHVTELLAAFEPNLEGVFGAMPITLGGETIIRWQQLNALFQVGQIDYAGLVAEFVPFYLEQGAKEYAENLRNLRRGIVRDEQLLAGLRARAETESGAEAASRWIQYRNLVAGRLVTRDLRAALQQRLLDAGPPAMQPAPYAFSTQVIERVRARLSPAAAEAD